MHLSLYWFLVFVLSAIIALLVLTAFAWSVRSLTEYAPEFSTEEFKTISAGNPVGRVFQLLGAPLFEVTAVREYEAYWIEHGVRIRVKEERVVLIDTPTGLDGAPIDRDNVRSYEVYEVLGSPAVMENIRYEVSMLYSKSSVSNSPIKGPHKRVEIRYDPKKGIVTSTDSYWYFD